MTQLARDIRSCRLAAAEGLVLVVSRATLRRVRWRDGVCGSHLSSGSVRVRRRFLGAGGCSVRRSHGRGLRGFCDCGVSGIQCACFFGIF